MSEEDAEYTENGLQSMSIHNIPVEQRLSFPEQGKVPEQGNIFLIFYAFPEQSTIFMIL